MHHCHCKDLNPIATMMSVSDIAGRRIGSDIFLDMTNNYTGFESSFGSGQAGQSGTHSSVVPYSVIS
jgi:hypothetical protein